MVARNDITGDKIQTRDKLSEQGEQNFDNIFGKKKTNGGWKPPTAEDITEIGVDLAKPTSTPTQPAEYAEDWQSSQRDRAIAQNGNVGYGDTNAEATTQVDSQSNAQANTQD